MSRGLSRGFGVGGTWRFWSREGWEPVPLRGGPERYSAEPNTSERPMAKKNGFCQQLCIDGGYAALDRGLGLSPVRPEPGWIWEASICGSRPCLCPVGTRSEGVHTLPDGNLSGRRAQARSGQQVTGLPGPAFDEGGLTSCQFGSVRKPSVHSPFQGPKDASETQIRGITPLPHTFFGSPLVGEKS